MSFLPVNRSELIRFCSLLLLILLTSVLAGWFLLLKLPAPEEAQPKTVATLNELSQLNDSGLLIYKADKVSPGITIVPNVGHPQVDLIDIKGNLLNTWSFDCVRARLLRNSNVLALHGTKWGREHETWKHFRNRVIEYDWQGKIVWDYRARQIVHHDVWRLDNGNTLFLLRSFVPAELKHQITSERRRKQKIRSDTIVEVNPSGQAVWKWHAHEHLDLNSCGRSNCEKPQAPGEQDPVFNDWTHTNTAVPLPNNQWYEKGHTEFRPGNIMILPRSWSTAMIVDRQTGAIVWEYSGDYKGGLSGSHEAHMIAPELPGAGNVLIFDNGVTLHRKTSLILEIHPVTKQIVWAYDVGRDFYSRRRGSVQRLANGNTLISSDGQGLCFEVTPEKEIVWLYKAKFEINRCRRYPLDWIQAAS